jgi:hypothetical protein
MSKSLTRTSLWPMCCALMLLVVVRAAHSQCQNIPAGDTCSYTGLNGDCSITIDRARPAAPPTIYARKGSKITLKVINLSPFEKLSLDFKSAQTVIPSDTFQGLMSSLSGSLQKLSITTVEAPTGLKEEATLEQVLTAKLANISERQKALFSRLDISRLMPQLAKVAQPLSPTACHDAQRYADAAKEGTPLPEPNPWFNTAEWKIMILAVLAKDSSGNPVDLVDVQRQLDTLDADIKGVTDNVYKVAAGYQTTINKQLDSVVQNQNTLKGTFAARADLVSVVNALAYIPGTSFTLGDFNQEDHNSLLVSWSLNYANVTGDMVKRVVTKPYKPAAPEDAVLSPSSKQPVTAVTVQYQHAARLEFATGLMVPASPFHSYSTAAVAKNGVITGYVIQETKTYTVVPAALVNFVVQQGIARKQPVAFLGTIAIGYNPSTSSVEFGVGPSFSWKSIMISGLADIGRDTQLAGGFTVGQTFPPSNPPKPLTSTGWFVKPAVALSVRIPLGGASK